MILDVAFTYLWKFVSHVKEGNIVQDVGERGTSRFNLQARQIKRLKKLT
jgi:hypothetical protein